MLSQSLDILRGKVMRFKNARSLHAIAKEMGLAADTLLAFLGGRPVSLASVTKVEAWVVAQECGARHE